MKIDRFMINICSDDLINSKLFYLSLFDFQVNYDSDWYIQLANEKTSIEFGIIDRNHPITPESIRGQPNGFYLTFVVPDVNLIFDKARTEGYTILEEPKDTDYGQRRMLLQDPNGVVIDISSLINN